MHVYTLLMYLLTYTPCLLLLHVCVYTHIRTYVPMNLHMQLIPTVCMNVCTYVGAY